MFRGGCRVCVCRSSRRKKVRIRTESGSPCVCGTATKRIAAYSFTATILQLCASSSANSRVDVRRVRRIKLKRFYSKSVFGVTRCLLRHTHTEESVTPKGLDSDWQISLGHGLLLSSQDRVQGL